MQFTIPGDPRGKQRPRFNIRARSTYTPSETVAYEKEVRTEFMKAGGKKYAGNIMLSIAAFYKIPASVSKATREKMLAGMRPTVKPDIDNVVKIIMDGLNGAAYYDDKQVVVLTAGKNYSDEPHVSVEVIEID